MRPTWRSTVRYAGRFHAHSLAFTGYDTRVGSVADLVCGGDRHFRRWPRRGIDDHRPVCFYADVPFARRWHRDRDACGYRARRHDGLLALRSARRRSEEHTSELQSLMRISYAVFCLKKKITIKTKSRIT